MLNVNDYIKLILQKKKWSNKKLCEEINKIEKQLGDSRTSVQNITNYLNGSHAIRPKFLLKVEKALGIETKTLIKMVQVPLSKEGKKEVENIIEKLKEVK